MITHLTSRLALAPFVSVTPANSVLVDGTPLMVEFTDLGGTEHLLLAILDGDRFEFSGSLTGSHSIAAEGRITSVERLLAHWTGYVDNAVAAADRASELDAASTLVFTRAA